MMLDLTCFCSSICPFSVGNYSQELEVDGSCTGLQCLPKRWTLLESRQGGVKVGRTVMPLTEFVICAAGEPIRPHKC